MDTTFDPDKRKLLSAISHGSIFLSTLVLSAGVPLAILFVADDPVVRDSAKESLNFHFNIWLYEIIFGFLTILLIGWPLLGLLFLVHTIMPILAILSCLKNPNEVYRYPFIFRLL